MSNLPWCKGAGSPAISSILDLTIHPQADCCFLPKLAWEDTAHPTGSGSSRQRQPWWVLPLSPHTRISPGKAQCTQPSGQVIHYSYPVWPGKWVPARKIGKQTAVGSPTWELIVNLQHTRHKYWDLWKIAIVVTIFYFTSLQFLFPASAKEMCSKGVLKVIHWCWLIL